MQLVRKHLLRSFVALVVILTLFAPGGVNAMSIDSAKCIARNTCNYGKEDVSTCSSFNGQQTGNLPNGVPEPFNSIITRAADKFDANASLIASLLYWENRGWPPADKTDWATSSAGAQGPMQFIPSTFDAYKVDGNEDQNFEINNIDDAIFTAANMVAENGAKTDTPLGSLDTPLAPNTLLRVAASYNWGGGNVQSASPDATLGNLPTETSDYLKAVYALISSDFTQSPQSGSTTTPIEGDSTTSPTASTGACGTSSVGKGSGQFIDNTDLPIPGADQAIARAQAIAKYSPSQLQAICDGSPNCFQRCDRLAAVVWGNASSGYETARVHWEHAKAAGTAHPGDRNVPPGALLFYDTGSAAGHVATYLGNNMLLSNDVKDDESGIKGGAYIVSADAMEGNGWNLTYLGWVFPVPWAV